MSKFLYYFNKSVGILCLLLMAIAFGSVTALMTSVAWVSYQAGDTQDLIISLFTSINGAALVIILLKALLDISRWRYEEDNY